MSFLLLCIYLITFYIRPQDWVPFFLGWPVDYIIIIPTILIGLSERAQKRNLDNKSAFFLPIYAFLLFYLLTIPISNIVHGDLAMAMEQFIHFFKKICVFIMFVVVIDTPDKLKRIVQFIIILTVILVIQGIMQSIHGYGWAGQTLYQGGRFGMRIKWVGFWDGANTLALGLASTLPLALGFVAKGDRLFERLSNLLFVGLLVYGIYLANSRGGFVAFLSIVPAYFLVKLKGKKKYLCAIAALILFPLLFRFGPARMAEVNTSEDSAHERTWLWESGLNMVRDNPILGIGKGQYQVGLHKEAHSNFVQNFAEVGLVGFFFWLGFIYLSFSNLQKIFNSTSKGGLFNSLGKAVFMSFVVYNIGTIFMTSEIELLYMLLGLSVCVINITREGNKKLDFKLTFADVRNIAIGMVGFIFLYYLLAMREIF